MSPSRGVLTSYITTEEETVWQIHQSRSETAAVLLLASERGALESRRHTYNTVEE